MQMIPFYYVLIGLLGASFISCGNCIRYRRARGMDWVRGHSVCEGCRRTLGFFDLIPVVSCLAMRGICPKCGHYFGYEHAASEAVGALLAVILALGYDDVLRALCPVCSFGLTYCVFSWFQGGHEHFNR